MNTTKIITSNCTLSNKEDVDFVVGLLWDLDSFKYADKLLSERNLIDFAKQAILERGRASVNNDDHINLTFDLKTLLDLCSVSIDTLDWYEDLETIRQVSKQEAYSHLAKIGKLGR